jgi:hypothetical protein
MAHEHYDTCIEACDACTAACNHCAAACLAESDIEALARCIRLDMDCAAMCQLASSAMQRGSDLAPQICGWCAELCDACGTECMKHSHEHCQRCATACKACADECRRMSQMRHADGQARAESSTTRGAGSSASARRSH